MRVAYVGHEALTFTDYIDLETGQDAPRRTGPGVRHRPRVGRVVPEVPEPWFIAVGRGVGPAPR